MRKIIFDIETDGIITNVGNKQIFPNIYVVCIYDSETDKYSSYTVEQLKDLWPILEKADLLIGYNSDSFDIPILNKYYSGDLTKITSLDLLSEIKESLGRRIKLDSVAEATLGRKKTGHGLEAMEWWKQGRIQDVINYCTEDVRITKDIYDYAVKNGFLKYKDINEIKEIKLDTSKWHEIENSAMTFTMPF
ncbi:MAG: ribonuclease H-like domain-containing protein [Candidatus Paceibacterota bacterium]|jgi:DEAD/DEAH box helicase domain-containing protein